MTKTRNRLKRYIDLANQANQAINSNQPSAKAAKLDMERWQAAIPALAELGAALAPDRDVQRLLDDVSLAIENTLANVPPPGLRPRRGYRHDFRTRVNIEAAVRYMLAARQGIIDDRSPRRTIAEAYCVSASTVKSWMQEYRDHLLANIAEGIDSPLGPWVKAAIEFAGHDYSEETRSRTAHRVGQRKQR